MLLKKSYEVHGKNKNCWHIKISGWKKVNFPTLRQMPRPWFLPFHPESQCLATKLQNSTKLGKITQIRVRETNKCYLHSTKEVLHLYLDVFAQLANRIPSSLHFQLCFTWELRFEDCLRTELASCTLVLSVTLLFSLAKLSKHLQDSSALLISTSNLDFLPNKK